MEVYGTSGYVVCNNARDMMIQESEKDGPYPAQAPELPKHINDPFTLLEQVVRGKYVMKPYDVSSLENNRIVMQILEASKESAKTGKTVIWGDFFKN